MSQLRVARDGAVLGEYPLDQVAEGAMIGTFLPTDDALAHGTTSWIKLAAFSGIQFPASAFPPPPAPSAPVAPPPPLPASYGGIYRSADEKILTGLCGGLAHKMGVDAGLVRFGLVLTWFFTASITFWIYWFALLLPKLPTKHLHRG